MKKVLITGGSGFIGRRLAQELLARGDRVTVLSRDAARARGKLPGGVRSASYTPYKAGPWTEELEVVDAVVHLAGEPVARRWSEDVKRAIEQSRWESTRVLVEAIGNAKRKPSTFVCASATGIYGPRRPDEELDESSEPGEGFLAEVVKRWEEAARGAEAHGVRTVMLRIGVVLGEGGGALEKMIMPFKLFGGGPIGEGTQIVSWIHRDDVIGMMLLALDDERAKGPINVTSPNPASSKELADAIGAVMSRPSWFRTPAGLIDLAMGEAASILTTGQRVYPRRAVELGYEFRKARLVPALESILGSG